jgi:Flavoprotein
MADRRAALVACGAPLAARMPDITVAIAAAGWLVSPIATTDALPWIDVSAVEDAAGQELRTAHRAPGTGMRSPLPDLVVICPATFNTINQLAAGTADTYVLSALCEWLGAGIPMLIVPMVNDRLWHHPAWSASLNTLHATLIDAQTGDTECRPIRSGTGDGVVTRFDPQWIIRALTSAS